MMIQKGVGMAERTCAIEAHRFSVEAISSSDFSHIKTKAANIKPNIGFRLRIKLSPFALPLLDLLRNLECLFRVLYLRSNLSESYKKLRRLPVVLPPGSCNAAFLFINEMETGKRF